MEINDKIRVAWAEWVIKSKKDPVVVILPYELYADLRRLCDERSGGPKGFTTVDRFCGMDVLKYSGDKILFA